VTGVAHELGYYDAAHFSRLFKQYRGIGPKAFQKRYADTGQSGAVDDHNGCAEHGTGFM
jgi:AraC-like DNA-binding protein